MRTLVTGAGARLGRAMAIYLAERGHDVAVHYSTSATGAEETAEAIRALGRRAVTLQADLLSEDATQALFPAAVAALGGPITCLVNNASIFEYDSIASASRTSWDRHMESNLRAPFVLTQAMAAQGLEPSLVLRDQTNVDKLQSGAIDLWATGDPAGRYLAKQQGVTGLKRVLKFDSAELYLALNLGIPDATVAKLQAALEQMRADGTLDTISSRYL